MKNQDLMSAFAAVAASRSAPNGNREGMKHPNQVTISLDTPEFKAFWDAFKARLGVKKNSDALIEACRLASLVLDRKFLPADE